MKGVTSAQINGLTTTALGDLQSTEFNALTNAQIDALNTTNFGKLATTQISGVTSTQRSPLPNGTSVRLSISSSKMCWPSGPRLPDDE